MRWERLPSWAAKVVLPITLVTIGWLVYRSATEQSLHQPAIAARMVPIVKVVDGDTVDIRLAGRLEAVRLVGINTPETVKPNWPVECYGPEASQRAKAILPPGTVVTLTEDLVSGDRDSYGRLLRYVTLPNGSDYGLGMIEGGYAHEYDFQGQPYVKRAEYQAAQADAKRNHRGLWNPTGCNGKP